MVVRVAAARLTVRPRVLPPLPAEVAVEVPHRDAAANATHHEGLSAYTSEVLVSFVCVQR